MLVKLTPVAHPVKLFFRFLLFSLSVLLHIEKIIDNRMTQLSSKKQRNSLLAKKKSYIGSTTRANPIEFFSSKLKILQRIFQFLLLSQLILLSIIFFLYVTIDKHSNITAKIGKRRKKSFTRSAPGLTVVTSVSRTRSFHPSLNAPSLLLWTRPKGTSLKTNNDPSCNTLTFDQVELQS